MRSSIKKGLLMLFALMMVLGYNTLDWMVNTFAWSPPIDGLWHMNTWFKWDFWNCYTLFGVLPLMFGAMGFGYLLHEVKQG